MRRNNRADRCVGILAIANPQLAHGHRHPLDQLVIDVAHSDDASGRRALLAGGTHGTANDQGHCEVQVGIVKHDRRVVAAKLELNAAVARRHNFTNAKSHRNRTSESDAIDAAISYLKNSYTSPLNSDGTPRDRVSGFSYTPGTHHPTFTMTAAGLLAMQVCGQYDSPLVDGASEWLLQNPPKKHERFFHYGIYYYAQAMHQVGGKYAEEADARVAKLLTPEQEKNGSWLPSGEERNIGTVYATALSVLSLSVRYHYPPIYQR